MTERGPNIGGRLSAIAVSPTSASTILVASPDGGIWRSTDGGSTRSVPQHDALADFSVMHLEWDKIRPGRVYASTYSDLYASTDLGDTWSEALRTAGLIASPISPPTDPPTMFIFRRWREAACRTYSAAPLRGPRRRLR